MPVPGQIFELVKSHKDFIYSGAGSLPCQFTDSKGDSQGAGAMLPEDDEAYDASDSLRGIPSFIGLSYDPDTGVPVSADQAELAVDAAKLTLGRPVKGWTGKMRNIDGTDLSFTVSDVMQDRTLGVYRIRLSILKATGTGRRIVRSGDGGV